MHIVFALRRVEDHYKKIKNNIPVSVSDYVLLTSYYRFPNPIKPKPILFVEISDFDDFLNNSFANRFPFLNTIVSSNFIIRAPWLFNVLYS